MNPAEEVLRRGSLADGGTDGGDLFQGGGELGDRMRAIDWSCTPLGPVDRWPQSLKTCVRIVLTSRQPMFVWWGDELINLYNDAYKSIVGGKHPVALGQPASVVWREIWEQVGPRARRTMEGNQGTYDEALLLIMERHGYQEETYYTFSYSPVPNDQGGTGGILCANTDDTQRIIGERRLALLRELAARTADARSWQDAFALSAEAMRTDDRDLAFALLYVLEPDQRALVLAGVAGIERGHRAAPERVELGGETVWPFAEVLDSHVPRTVGGLADRFAELPTGSWPRPPSEAVIWPIAPRGQTGRAGVLVVGLNPFRPLDDDYRTFLSLVAGQIAASVANAQAYEQERRRAEALAEIDRAKTAFFSNVSHEFRTPLTLILGPQEDALAAPDGVLAGESLRAVHRNTLRLLRLVNALLEFSRIEAGRVQAAYQPTDLAAATADLASTFRSAIENGGVKLQVELEPLPEPVHVDRDMWEKIVLNLLSNAFKFTFEGTIRVALRAAGDHAELTVADTGIGIAPQELPRLFERFHRVEGARARTHEGSGIGLALVRDLVGLHGGTVAVQSRPGAGTTFTVCLPFGSAHLPPEGLAAPATAPRREVAAEPFVQEALRWIPGVTPAPAPAGAATVLVADDNADMREYMARLLRPHWTVVEVADGVQALEVARERPPDLILSDVMMPNLGGFGLLRALREDPRTAGIAVVMLSARAGEEARVEGLAAGADDYLVKPFSARELIARVRVHLENRRLRRAAESERNRLRGLLRDIPAIVNFLRGPELVLEFAHPGTMRVLGRLDIVGKPLLEAIPEFRDQEYPALLRRVLETGEPIEGREKLVLIGDGTGERRPTYWNFVYLPVHGDDGTVEGVMTFDLEVTEQVQARQALEEQAQRLADANEKLALAHRDAERSRLVADAANRAKDEFLAMLGHELRNPLSPILTSLQLLRMHGHDTREQKVIERQVAHLIRLVDDLLDISRITRGRIELRKQRLELAEAVVRGLEIAHPLLEQRRMHVECNVPPDGLPVEGDPHRLAQVISNLLTNAAKYSEPGSQIRVSASRQGNTICLRVRDSGIGIAPDMLDRIFDVFVQQPQSLDRSKGGLGLGLAIVKSLVALHGGRVSAHSAGAGQGSELVVELPISPTAEELAEPKLLGPAGGPGAAAPPERNRILVVDDNVDAADSVAELLREMGYQVETAHDGPSALVQARQFRPHICLLDIGLPVMDGYEVARRLRASGELAGLRIIALTGYGQDADRGRAREAGFDAHVVKPVSLDLLAEVMAGVS
jgi:signal transduction histidine kinase